MHISNHSAHSRSAARFPHLLRKILPVVCHRLVAVAKAPGKFIICGGGGNVTHPVVAHAQLDRREIVAARLLAESLVGLVSRFHGEMIPERRRLILSLFQKNAADLTAHLRLGNAVAK